MFAQQYTSQEAEYMTTFDIRDQMRQQNHSLFNTLMLFLTKDGKEVSHLELSPKQTVLTCIKIEANILELQRNIIESYNNTGIIPDHLDNPEIYLTFLYNEIESHLPEKIKKNYDFWLQAINNGYAASFFYADKSLIFNYKLLSRAIEHDRHLLKDLLMYYWNDDDLYLQKKQQQIAKAICI